MKSAVTELQPKTAGVSKQDLVFQDLFEKIERGQMTGALPGVRQLADDYGVNFMTVNKAMKRLEAIDAVYRIPRIGTYVKRRYCFAACYNDPAPNLLSAPVYSLAIQAAQLYLQTEHNCPIFLAGPLNSENHMLSALANRVDGSLLIYNELHELPEGVFDMPCVRIMGTTSPHLPCDQVTYDSGEVSRLAAQYLLDRGYRRVAFIGDSSKNIGIFGRRLQSFTQQMQGAGGSVAAFKTPWTHDFQSVEVQVNLALALDPRPEAFFVGADAIANAVVSILFRQGIDAGKDLGLVSCNNVANTDPFSPFHFPSVDICSTEIGELGARQLIARLEDPDKPYTIRTVTPRLIIPS